LAACSIKATYGSFERMLLNKQPPAQSGAALKISIAATEREKDVGW
jgi:hypothetical protein